MYRNETIIHRQVHCRWCGEELEHRPTGRAREFCSDKCRVYHRRAFKRHARACVDAALAGKPEPECDFGQPIEIRSYVVSSRDGLVFLVIFPCALHAYVPDSRLASEWSSALPSVMRFKTERAATCARVRKL